MGSHLPTTSGKLITADHKILNLDDESRNNLRNALSSYKTHTDIGRLIQRKTKDAQETTSCLLGFLPPFQKPGSIFTDNSKEFTKACQDMQGTHDMNTHHRSETDGIAKRAVTEGTATAQECVMQRYCYLRNVHDKMADGKTSYDTTLVWNSMDV